MDIKSLAKERKLVPVSLDQPELVERYGEPIQFWCWDRVPTTDFLRINTLDDQSNPLEVCEVMRDFILDETGEPVVQGELSLPVDIMVAAVRAVSDCLGKCWTPENWTVKAPSSAL